MIVEIQANKFWVFSEARYFSADVVHNYTSSFEFLWDEITIPLTFESDIQLARKLLLELAEEHTDKYIDQAERSWNQMRRDYKLEDASLENQVYISLNENVAEISLRYVVDYQERRIVKDHLYTDIFKRFKDAGEILEIAPNTLEVTSANKKSF